MKEHSVVKGINFDKEKNLLHFSNHCTLYAFLMDYIKDVFLGQIHVDNGIKITFP